MKRKALFKFYFNADALNSLLDGLIFTSALQSGSVAGDAENCARKIDGLIQAKMCLGALWNYLDGIMNGLSERERLVLNFYGNMRLGLKALSDGQVREIKRVAIKFMRRAYCVNRYEDGLQILGKYYCLL